MISPDDINLLPSPLLGRGAKNGETFAIKSPLLSILSRKNTGRLLIASAGFTLVELIVAMVVISIALVGVMSVINYTTSHSSDPVLRQQAISIAEAYMEEISLKNYVDPDADGEGNRGLFDDVDDYNGLSDSGAVDQNGNAISGLGNYSVSVSITPQNYGPAGNEVSGLKIDVTVTDPVGGSLILTGYRANY